jgi:hypothetical protein
MVAVRAFVGPAGQRRTITGLIALPAAAVDILGIQPENQARIDDRFACHGRIGGNHTPDQHGCHETQSIETGK